MKQTNLMRWIEDAEARSICLLAGESPARVTLGPALRHSQPIPSVLARLREQFCLGEASKRLARLYRTAA